MTQRAQKLTWRMKCFRKRLRSLRMTFRLGQFANTLCRYDGVCKRMTTASTRIAKTFASLRSPTSKLVDVSIYSTNLPPCLNKDQCSKLAAEIRKIAKTFGTVSRCIVSEPKKNKGVNVLCSLYSQPTCNGVQEAYAQHVPARSHRQHGMERHYWVHPPEVDKPKISYGQGQEIYWQWWFRWSVRRRWCQRHAQNDGAQPTDHEEGKACRTLAFVDDGHEEISKSICQGVEDGPVLEENKGIEFDEDEEDGLVLEKTRPILSVITTQMTLSLKRTKKALTFMTMMRIAWSSKTIRHMFQSSKSFCLTTTWHPRHWN